MPRLAYIPSAEEAEALGVTRTELANWKYGTIDITDDVSYTMRNEIKSARKNFYGKFIKETDTATNLDKIFVPLTEWSVETMVKNVDLDTRHIQIKAPNASSVGIASVFRMILQNFMKKIKFGELLNDIQRRTIIDGTCVVKVTNKYSREHKRKMVNVSIVDLLNFFIDPAARSIQESSAVIEMNLITKEELNRYRGKWDNLEYVQPISTGYLGTEAAASGFTKQEVPLIDIYERWGLIDKSWATKREEDKGKWVEGLIIASGINSAPVIHKIMLNDKGVRPYEECWMKRTPSRWHGRGIPEILKGLQLYLNSIVNIRRNNALLLQNGIFKVRKGAGITQQSLTSLKAGGAIPVDNMDDIEELRTGDIKASSYQDEMAIYVMAERVTGTKELPSNTSMEPTTAVIQERDVKSAANMVQENLGLFLQRLFKRHIIPLLIDSLEDREVIRITGNPEDIEEFDNNIIDYFLGLAILDYYKKYGIYPKDQEIEAEREKAKKKLSKMGVDRFLEIWKENFDVDFDIDIDITAEEFDKAVMAKQLNDLLFAYSKLPGTNLDVNAVMRAVLDLLGLPGNQLINKNQPAQVLQGQELATPGKEIPTPQGLQEQVMPLGGG